MVNHYLPGLALSWVPSALSSGGVCWSALSELLAGCLSPLGCCEGIPGFKGEQEWGAGSRVAVVQLLGVCGDEVLPALIRMKQGAGVSCGDRGRMVVRGSVCVCVYVLVAQACLILCDPMDCMWPTRFLCPLVSPGNYTGVGCHFLF